MKASYQMTQLPESGVQVTIEGALLRLLFDFSQAEPREGEESTDIYNCESVDVKGRGYGDIVSAIVNDRYSSDEVSDITAEKRAEYLEEYEAYQNWRKHAKEIAAEVISNL